MTQDIATPLAAAYTKALLQNPKDVVHANIVRALSECPHIENSVNIRAEIITDIRYIKDLANAHDAGCLNSDTFNAVRIVELCNELLAKAGAA